MGRPECLDLSDEEITDSFNSLLSTLETVHLGLGCCMPEGRTFRTSFSNNGPRSASALVSVWAAFFLCAAALLSSSDSAFTHTSSICPSAILETTAGEILRSSTIGPRHFSTAFLFSSFMLRVVDLACSVSISAETAARSFRKLVRFVSTELRMSSQARIDR